MYCKIGRQWRDRRNCVDGISYPCVSGCTPTLFRILQDTWSNEDVLQRTLPESITRSYLSQSPRLPFSFSPPLLRPLPTGSPLPTFPAGSDYHACFSLNQNLPLPLPLRSNILRVVYSSFSSSFISVHQTREISKCIMYTI